MADDREPLILPRDGFELMRRLADAVKPVIAEAVVAERERIRALAIARNATCEGDGTTYSFADLLGEP